MKADWVDTHFRWCILLHFYHKGDKETLTDYETKKLSVLLKEYVDWKMDNKETGK